MRLNDDGKTVAAADCLVPGIGEIIGGSQREERLDVLEAPHRRSWAWTQQDYWWYLRPAPVRLLPARRLRPGLRAHGDVPHGRRQHPGRAAPSANGGQRGVLNFGRGEERLRFVREAGDAGVSGCLPGPWPLPKLGVAALCMHGPLEGPHTGGLRGVFSGAHVPGKNGF